MIVLMAITVIVGVVNIRMIFMILKGMIMRDICQERS